MYKLIVLTKTIMKCHLNTKLGSSVKCSYSKKINSPVDTIIEF